MAVHFVCVANVYILILDVGFTLVGDVDIDTNLIQFYYCVFL